MRAALLLVLLASPASAMTGAEFLDTGRLFGIGYARGAAEAFLRVPGAAGTAAEQARLDACVKGAKISAAVLFETVATYIRSHPEALAAEASRSVVAVVREMCP